jgi:hypothetical protein
MIDNRIGAMFITTVIMGVTMMLMSWIIFVVAIKGWAGRRKVRYARKVASS